MNSVAAKGFWTLSFSGAGHLLPYHLGAASTLLKKHDKEFPAIHAVAGSSSGAIAAAVMTMLPHRLEEYTDRFLQDRGHALRNLKGMLQELGNDSQTIEKPPQFLVVCTTKSLEGSMHLFTFDNTTNNKITLNGQVATNDMIHRVIQASCTIPKSFHPIDMFSKSALSYPDGIEIDGVYHADGGIVAPAPRTPFDDDPNCIQRIVVSPISGGLPNHIRPKNDNTFALPGGDWTARCGTFQIRPSIHNMRALVSSLGVVSPESLKEWCERGSHDAQAFLDDWRK